MQALSMIDTNMNVTETVVPAKSTEPKGKHFGTVMKEQCKAEATQKGKPEQQVASTQDAGHEKGATVGETQQPETQVVDSTKASEQVSVVAEAENKVKPKLQQTVVQLMKVIAGGETSQAAEEFGSVEELLTHLVQQLEDADLKGEQVLAGIDLSVLVEQLQIVGDEGGEATLAQVAEQLGIQLDQQLSDDQDLLINTELAGATLLNEDPQAVAPMVIENLAQARQILQKAIDAAVTTVQGKSTREPTVVDSVMAVPLVSATEKTTVVAAEAQNEALLLAGEAGEEIDPRFAGLLKPRTEATQAQSGLRQQMQNEAANSKAAATPIDPAVAGQSVAAVVTEQPETADFEELLNLGSKGLEKLAQQAQGQVQPGFSQVQNGSVRVAPQAPMIQLPSGQQVAESQIFDQVVTHISGSHNGESGRMVLRFQPAELGSLKLELMVEGDRVKANIHAQTMQVQEVIERNLPQLRNALAEQGLKIDQFQVNVDQRQQGSQFENQAQQDRQQGTSQQQDWSQDLDVEEQAIPLAHLMQNGGGGISLHV